MSGFRHLGEEEIARLDLIGVYRGRFEAPDGSRFERDIVRVQDVVAIVPLHEDGTVTLVEQYRAPIDRTLLEIPAGRRDVPGEAPEETARRELREEAGLAAATLTPLAKWYANAGFCDQHVRLYLATGLSEVGTAREGPEEQAMTMRRLALEDVPEAIASGKIQDAETIIGLLAVRTGHVGADADDG